MNSALREKHERIRELYARSYTQREISVEVELSLSEVNRHIVKMRAENIIWFEENKDPNGRMRSLFSEIDDSLLQTIREAWARYNEALALDLVKTAGHVKLHSCNEALDTLLKAINLRRLHLRLVAPSMDEIYYRQELESLRKQLVELRQLAKITVTPIIGVHRQKSDQPVS